jgi:two-component system sensor histidine kinase DctS
MNAPERRPTAIERRPALGPFVPGRLGRFLGLMPAAAIVLVIITVAMLLWFLDRNEREEQRATMINDALWVEQALRFAVQSDVDDISALASSIREEFAPAAARPRMEFLLRSSPEIESIVWYDARGAVTVAVPGAVSLAPPEVTETSRKLAIESGHATMSQVFPLGKSFAFEFTAPLYAGTNPAGVLSATFKLDGLLANHVPWWVTQKYLVEFVDGSSKVLAQKAGIAPEAGAPNHAIAFDPPGGGLVLKVIRYDNRTRLATNALFAAIVAFSLLAVISLVAMRNHMVRRGQAELALRQEHSFRKAMEDSLTVGMRARDLDGRIVYVNQAFCRMVGWSEAELVGHAPPMPYWIPEDIEHTLELHQLVLDGRAPPEGFEIRFMRRGGEVFDALVYEAPLIDAEGCHRGWMGSVLDITDRKRAESLARQQSKKLAHTARLVTMGEMASTLAHELNQPLAAISSYATGSLKRLENGPVGRDELLAVMAKLSAQSQRAGQIIRRVREFVRKSEPQFATIDMASLVAGTIDFVLPELRAQGISASCDAGQMLPCCTGDRILLEQVMLNLLRNAIEAMNGIPKRNRKLTVKMRMSDGECIVSVVDRGAGLSVQMRDRLFVPFATTKAEGMGMGLNICRTIVEMHRGRLWFEDRPGGGSIFAFSIPVYSS